MLVAIVLVCASFGSLQSRPATVRPAVLGEAPDPQYLSSTVVAEPGEASTLPGDLKTLAVRVALLALLFALGAGMSAWAALGRRDRAKARRTLRPSPPGGGS